MTYAVRSNQNDSSELMHFGIKGMKWGVRRTPEQLGHPTSGKKNKAAIASNKLQKYKDKKIKKVDKMYAKAIRQTEEALEYDPKNRNLKKQLRGLNNLKQKDIDKIESMSYTDVVNEQKAIRQARIQKAGKIASTTAATVGSTALWAAKMGLVGVRIYGTFKAAELVMEAGGRAIEWLNSPEGQELINDGLNMAGKLVKVGDAAVTIANPELRNQIDSKYIVDQAIKYGKSAATDYVKTNVPAEDLEKLKKLAK